ncbi:cytochrome P460 family protein [Paracoccus albus]|uniref:cytochrome P460 family protein n=1 Tax=Paracoccus albus TaxID=3017784 RepID=UPI0022F08CC1|nr:cytochrome P460 family protein [Paracoccus albus]WBU60570.1 cytochrome P460 family protein [Paracoccus albus]
MRFQIFATLGLCLTAQIASAQDNSSIQLPPEGARGEQYTTVTRGGITEHIFTSDEAIAAARDGEPFPNGTVITMDDYRDGALHRILVMEKRGEWEGGTAGAWRFREFAPDGSPNLSENGGRCASCHAGRAADDYVFTRDRMSGAN